MVTLKGFGFKFSSGNIRYYTGRAGSGWLSDNPNDAFKGYSKEFVNIRATDMKDRLFPKTETIELVIVD